MTTSASAVATFPGSALTQTVPSLGNLDAYITAVNRIPLLTAQEEASSARRLREGNDLEAARALILSHLRLVVSVSRQYLGYGLPQADLIQEGNVGLMKAVKRFDPDRGVRLVSFALHWIKAEMHEYILKNWRLVKVATTKAQRKLFFNLRSMKANRLALTPEAVREIARELNVRESDVVEMDTRFAGGDLALEPIGADDSEEGLAPIGYLAAPNAEPTAHLEQRQRDRLQSEGIELALASLDERSRKIVESRWLRDDMDGGTRTLQDLASEYGVSAERIRQIEAKALKKMKTALADFA